VFDEPRRCVGCADILIDLQTIKEGDGKSAIDRYAMAQELADDLRCPSKAGTYWSGAVLQACAGGDGDISRSLDRRSRS
jgi:hypothetical protein